MKEYDKQIAALENAKVLDANFAPIYESLGYIYMFREQFDKAEAAFKEYIRLL